MNTLNWLSTEISNIFYSLVWSAVTWASILGFLGFIASIFMVRYLNRAGYFQRSNKIWTFFAKINLIYIPILLPIYLAAMGAIFGVQKMTNSWIERTTKPIAEYAVAFVPSIQQLGAHINSQLTLEEALNQELFNGQPLAANSWEQEMQLQYNSAITTALLDEFGYPHEIDGLIRLAREQNLEKVNAAFFRNIPYAIQDYCGTYFWMAYSMVWAAFLPFFLIPLVEFGIYFIYTKRFKSSRVINYSPNDTALEQAA